MRYYRAGAAVGEKTSKMMNDSDSDSDTEIKKCYFMASFQDLHSVEKFKKYTIISSGHAYKLAQTPKEFDRTHGHN